MLTTCSFILRGVVNKSSFFAIPISQQIASGVINFNYKTLGFEYITLMPATFLNCLLFWHNKLLFFQTNENNCKTSHSMMNLKKYLLPRLVQGLHQSYYKRSFFLQNKTIQTGQFYLSSALSIVYSTCNFVLSAIHQFT